MRCPSHDWDDYANQQDQAAEAERCFYRDNADRILLIVAALIEREPPGLISNKRLLVEHAAAIVLEVVQRGYES